jgi:Beta-lactamase
MARSFSMSFMVRQAQGQARVPKRAALGRARLGSNRVFPSGGLAMTRFLVLVLFALSSATLAVAQPEPARPAAAAAQKLGFSPERLARIGEVMNGEVAKGTLPGAVVLVARRGQLAYFEAFGFQDKDAGKKMTKDSIFRVYSMTKPFVSVAAMMLMEEGKLELTDPVSKFLPSFKGLKVAAMKKDPATGEVTYTTAPRSASPPSRTCSGTRRGSSTTSLPRMRR